MTHQADHPMELHGRDPRPCSRSDPYLIAVDHLAAAMRHDVTNAHAQVLATTAVGHALLAIADAIRPCGCESCG